MAPLLVGCNKNNLRKYQDDFVYNDPPVYEPIDIASDGKDIDRVEFVGFPYNHEIKVAAFDDTDAAVRVWYSDHTTATIPIKIQNIPLEFRHLFGEIGEHSIEMIFNGQKENFEFTIVDNPDFKGYNCYFYDRNKKLIDTQVVGYYQPVTYQGKPLPESEEDDDYRYTFNGWNHDTEYVHQDMQFMAKYLKLEKRWYAIGLYNRESTSLSSIVNASKTKGSTLAYLGRIKRVPAFYGPTVELDNEDVKLCIEASNYTSYIRELQDTIIEELITYRVDSEYNTKLYGNVSEIVTHPTFANAFNGNYSFKGTKAYLANQEDVEISSENPIDGIVSEITRSLNYARPTITKDSEPGFYRAAIVGSFDVYLDISFSRLDKDIYEIGNFNQFVIAPVKYSFKMDIEHSYTEEFNPNFETSLTVSTKTLYYMADAIDWSMFAN